MLAQAVQRFEKMKPAFIALQQENSALKFALAKDETIIKGKDNLINWYRGAYGEEQAIRQSKDAEVVIWKRKAKKRGWIIGVAIAVPATYGAYKGAKALMSIF